ncbi:hypothetical protein VPH35_024462 [Triticum aestivum]
MAAAARICYNHVLFLLEPVHVFATTHLPKNCYHGDFCWNRRAILLQPFLVFATTGVSMDFCYIHLHECEFATLFFASTSHCFCWNHQAFLLELAIFPWVRVRKHFSSVGSASHFFYNRRAVSASTNIFFCSSLCFPDAKHSSSLGSAEQFLIQPVRKKMLQPASSFAGTSNSKLATAKAFFRAVMGHRCELGQPSRRDALQGRRGCWNGGPGGRGRFDATR